MPEVSFAAPAELRHVVLAQCDRCRIFPGFDFLDGWWLCQLCRRAYLDQISQEANESLCRVN